MKRQDFMQMLDARRIELTEELETINKLFSLEECNNSIVEGHYGVKESTKSVSDILTPKDNLTWDKYVQKMLTQMGGKAKSADITEAIIKANPKIKRNLAEHATRHHLSLLLKKNMIGAVRNPIKSQGYEFFPLTRVAKKNGVPL